MTKEQELEERINLLEILVKYLVSEYENDCPYDDYATSNTDINDASFNWDFN